MGDAEGLSIEPTWYCPILPMILVNGCDGIGTGYATSVPNFNPREIITNLKRFIQHKESRKPGLPKLDKMMPWYQGFKGLILESKEENKCEVIGLAELKDGGKVEITELPVKKWTQDYREFLEELLPKGQSKRDSVKLIEDYAE